MATLGVMACEPTKVSDTAPTYRLTATVTQNNTCQVSVQDRVYSSVNVVRGDVPKAFIGTLPNATYHGFGCWVSVDGGVSPKDGDGDLVVIFSGNNFGKPLDPGTYPLKLEILDDTPVGFANVTFRPSNLNGDRLTTMDGAQGSVIVTATADGGRMITIDTQVSRYNGGYFY
jgi:hypothetical protein